jgi:hypothetical protein
MFVTIFVKIQQTRTLKLGALSATGYFCSLILL